MRLRAAIGRSSYIYVSVHAALELGIQKICTPPPCCKLNRDAQCDYMTTKVCSIAIRQMK